MNAAADNGLWTADSGVTADSNGPGNPTFSAAQYGLAARSLLPPGRAWNREDGSNQASFCDALGDVYEQQDAASVRMLSDFFPATATQGISEWNATLGIPDPCGGPPATQAINQQQIVARLIASGGQKTAYFVALAAALGYEISITEFSPTLVGNDAPPGLINTAQDWAYTWRVNILNAQAAPGVTMDSTGVTMDSTNATVDGADTSMLECLLERYKPAHTQFYIVNGTPSPVARLFTVVDKVSAGLIIQV